MLKEHTHGPQPLNNLKEPSFAFLVSLNHYVKKKQYIVTLFEPLYFQAILL